MEWLDSSACPHTETQMKTIPRLLMLRTRTLNITECKNGQNLKKEWHQKKKKKQRRIKNTVANFSRFIVKNSNAISQFKWNIVDVPVGNVERIYYALLLIILSHENRIIHYNLLNYCATFFIRSFDIFLLPSLVFATLNGATKRYRAHSSRLRSK